MIYSITIPAKDYKLIERYVKKGSITPGTVELLGRVYEAGDKSISVTAEIMKDNQAILYSASMGNEVPYQCVIRSLSCYFEEFGVIVAFDLDKSYD